MKLTPAVVQQLLPEGQQLESAIRLDASNKDISEASTCSCCMPPVGAANASVREAHQTPYHASGSAPVAELPLLLPPPLPPLRTPRTTCFCLALRVFANPWADC